MNNEKRTRKQWILVLEHFKSLKKMVHISTKNSIFYNGYILKVDKNYFSIEDRIKGEVPIFYNEIKNIEEFTLKNLEIEVNNHES